MKFVHTTLKEFIGFYKDSTWSSSTLACTMNLWTFCSKLFSWPLRTRCLRPSFEWRMSKWSGFQKWQTRNFLQTGFDTRWGFDGSKFFWVWRLVSWMPGRQGEGQACPRSSCLWAPLAKRKFAYRKHLFCHKWRLSYLWQIFPWLDKLALALLHLTSSFNSCFVF